MKHGQQNMYIIDHPVFASWDTGIYPHAASQYRVRPKAKRGIAMLNVEKFQYSWKQIKSKECIPCLNGVCHILKQL